MEIILPLIYSILYGITMKVADLLDEHGLKWFKYADVTFGILCGIFGSLIILSTNTVIAAVLIAQVVSCIIRKRLDYLNHQIAATLIFVAVFWYGVIDFSAFLIFLIIFIVFGIMKDYFDDVKKIKTWWSKMSELMLYYPIPTFIYCLFFGNWLLFWVFTLYTISYNLTKYIGAKKGYN